ncbi:MAG: NAD(P)-binding protein, partial [Syntrophobacteraceae bacterium]
GTSPCKATCPAHISVQGYVALTAQGKYREALQLIKEENPLPAICGRVCHHPCESACMRGGIDEPVAIDSIKRFLADLDLNSETRFVPQIKEKRSEKVAIIGSGPAGLSCAYYLAIEGYGVTVFEKLPVLGGMLTVGIPSYRLPKNTIEAEIQVLRDMGVEFKTGVEIGKDFTISQLRDQGYKAFFMGIGAQECKALGIPGDDLEGVVPGVEYLRDINLGKKVSLGDRVAVIGGGNVAMDTVRTALRSGSGKPFIIYRRSENEMPANEEEIHECREEGIDIMTLTNPIRIIGEKGRVKAVECIRMQLGEPDASGRRRPVPIPGSEFVMEVDALVPAIGQESDWACLTEECACKLTDWGTMKVDPLTCQTHDNDIFAGGDAVTGPRTVIEAISAGKQAAISIGRYIRGEDIKAGREREWEAVQEVATEGYDRIPRARMPVVSPEIRTGNFEEVQLGLTEEQVRAEANRCLSCGVCSECYQCVEACLANAINHDEMPKALELNVGAIIAAPGFRAFDPSKLDTYGYGKFPNVVTSMEFERYLSPSGPTQGHLVRPSDHEEPKKIAWIQCVGSRDRQHEAHSYCSGVCCMYAIKEAMVAKEHCPNGLDTAIFYMDMRTYGKDFEKYYNRARDKYGVRFIRSRVHTVDPIPGSGSVTIQYATEAGEQFEEEFDMVVLSVGVETTPETVELAKRLGIEVTEHNFASTGGFTPVSSSRPGVYVCGLFQGPKDIPQSVMEASAAACAAAIDLAPARGSQVTVKEIPVEKDTSEEEPRIGVFVCNCGINIASVVDVKEVTKYAATLPNVAYTTDYLFTCSQDSQEQVKEIIKENRLNRVVVAACSPRTHEPLFQETLKDCGLNKYLFEMANIRDQDSWVHQKEPEAATAKAKDLVRMSVARASLLRPLVETSLTVNPRALVVGGGIAGMNAALGLARQGFESIIVEKGAELGGMARNISHTIDGLHVSEYLAKLVGEVQANSKIEVLTGARLSGVSGYKGNFVSQIENGAGGPREFNHGAIIVATGAREYKPTEFLYGQSDRIMTQLELGKLLSNNPGDISNWNRVIMIQCVGSRNEENPNCSRICCQGAVKHALELKQLNPEMDVVVFYRDMRTYGVLEDYYTKARQAGVLFVRFDEKHPPEVSKDSEWPFSVSFVDHVLRRPVKMSADAVILSAATLAEENEELAMLLKVPRNPEGFFIEAHAKLRPVDFASEGIYLCGTAHGPKLIPETIAQSMAAAARAASFLSSKDVTVGGVVAQVEPGLCAACLVCVRNCPYGVPRINDQDVSEINEALCQGCGICVSECPAKAIRLGHYADDQIMIKVDALLEGVI